MSLKFGTDGIRGVAYSELTLDLARRLGAAAAQMLGADIPGGVLIGRDTRSSGPDLQAALTAGFNSTGMNVIDLGVIPTPGVAFCSGELNLPAAVISASHNPYQDNGIKFFLPGGKKLSDEIEERLEMLLAGIELGFHDFDEKIVRDYQGCNEYVQHLWTHETNNATRVVLDCANGAASEIAERVFQSFDAIILSNEPNGTNINDGCGSTHPEKLQLAVVDQGAAAGFAFDGDADRVLAVDHTGALVDGDHLLALLAIDMKSRNKLKDDTLVITVMSNLGLKLAMEEAGIKVHETAVGDRYVLEALDANSWSLGGEQSGHIILPEFASTGDGMLTALQVLDVMARAGKSLQELASVVTQLPQVLRNVRVKDRSLLEGATRVWDEVKRESDELGHTGRVLLRTSGTEPLVRVMVEAPTHEIANAVCNRLCEIVESELAA